MIKTAVYAVLIVLLWGSVSMGEDLLVVANRSVPVATLSRQDVKNIYLGKKKMWPGNIKITFVKLNQSALTDRFLKAYVNQSQSMFSRYWEKKVFTGTGRAPRTFDRPKDLVEFVSVTKGAIGYIDAGSYRDKLKILSVIH